MHTTTLRIIMAAACLVPIVAPSRSLVVARTGSLPAGWQSRDIEPVGQPGATSVSQGTWTVSGAGAAIWGTSDAFHFAYRSVTGDVTITAKVSDLLAADPLAKVGVMVRATTNTGAQHALTVLRARNEVMFQRRHIAGGTTSQTLGGAASPPRWLRLKRVGNVFTSSSSADGSTWTRIGSDTISMSSTVLVGLAANSHDTTRLSTGTFTNVVVTTPPAGVPPLEVAPNHRFLRTRSTGRHVFYLADTAWGIFSRLNRADADLYLQDVAAKGFNAVQAVALWRMSSAGNAYGDSPIGKTGTRYDPAKILTTPGSDPNDAAAYDYWDHVDYIIDRAAQKGLYVALEPTWGNYVSGSNSYCTSTDASSNIFTIANARMFGNFIGRRYGGRRNVIWMLGGDRPAVCAIGDFRPVWRALSEGIGRAVTGQPLFWNQPHLAWSQLLMTYHATKRDTPGSSMWFHDDPWLSFNGIQSEYYDIASRLRGDWSLTPAQPTLLLEGRYEDEPASNRIMFTGAWKQRYQLYQAALSGSLGYAYGHHSIWDFLTNIPKTWRIALNDPGRTALQQIRQLLASLTDTQLFARMPDQSLLDGASGGAHTEDLLVAMRGSDRRFALVYSTNGRDIRLKASGLAAGTADAFWFSPRTGHFHTSTGALTTSPFTSFPTGASAALQILNPPGTAGADNDWVLKVVVR